METGAREQTHRSTTQADRTIHSLFRCFWLGVAVALCAPLAYGQDTDVPRIQLTDAATDSNTPEANSTVWVGGCTGTLIQPDMVITAGHCINRPADFVAEDRRWYPTGLLVNRRTDDIQFGNDRSNFVLRMRATHFSVVNGADMALLALAGTVPSEVAVPTRVLTAPRPPWDDKVFVQAGWGQTSDSSGAPNLRRVSTATYRAWPCHTHGVLQADKFCVSGSTVLPGDSGGPLYWTDRSGVTWLIGVAQGQEAGGGRYVPTFLGGGVWSIRDGDGARYQEPDIASFLADALKYSACSQVRMQGQTAGGPLRALTSWYSRGRADNSASGAGVWQGCPGDARAPDYGFSLVEGLVHSPDEAPPAGTIPLYRWYSPSRGDNWLTTQHAGAGARSEGLSPDYRFSQLEGYVYPPSHGPRPGLVPLHRWYSPSRGDNWTTVQHADEGGRGEGLAPDYRFGRLEGYVLRSE